MGESMCTLPQIWPSCASSERISYRDLAVNLYSEERFIVMQKIASIKTHKCTQSNPLHNPYFEQHSDRRGCRHGHRPVSLHQAAGCNQQRHDKATMELDLLGSL